MSPLPERQRVRTALVVPACLLGALVVALPSSASVERRQVENALPQQIWAIVVGPKAAARIQTGMLERVRARGINTTVAAGLSRRQLVRLRTLNARAKLSVLTPSRRGSCRRAASICALEADSISRATRLRRKRGVDVVVVRVPGPSALGALPARGRRVLAVARLRGGRFDAASWRRAIQRAFESPGLDLAVEPVGRRGDRALTSYLTVLAAVRAGDRESPPPSPLPPPPPTSPRPPPSPVPPSAPGTLTLQTVDGGPEYYGQFVNSLPTSPGFFPIGVWGAYDQTQANMDKDASVGINTYVWAADAEFFDDIRADGRFQVIQDEGGDRAPMGSENKGWLLGDEIDMSEGPSACPARINQIKAGLPADGRLRYANYGKGVVVWSRGAYNGHTNASAACFVNAQDVTSTDLYWHTDPWETDSMQSGTSWGYGWTMKRQRMFDATDGVRTPQWGFVEVGHPFETGGTIFPAEIRGAVWHTLIAGARGIVYFQHSFGGNCPTHHALRDGGTTCYGAVVSMVTSVDAQIRSLAPVLNSPFVRSGHSLSGAATRRMVKWDGFNFYVFLATKNGGNATFSMPCVGDATATVLGESRTVPVRGGAFNDSFEDTNAVHIYRIDGGSTCALS